MNIIWPDAGDIELLHAPHPTLSQYCDPVDDVPEYVIKRMCALMREHEGIGLAAPQVGLPYRFFIMQCTKDGQPAEMKLIIDPAVYRKEGKMVTMLEGCLSIPDMKLPVRRMDTIVVSHYERLITPDGDFIGDKTHFNDRLIEFNARVYQHEEDHVRGVLFTQRFADMFDAKSLRERDNRV